jgi:DNA-binding transcriptional LysR family regulator
MRVLSSPKLKAFQLAGMTGSYEHAAHLLAIGSAAVRARVRSLEGELGVRLFQRGRGKLTLTEAGASYLHEVEAAFVTFDLATADLCTRFADPTHRQPEKRQRRAIVARAVALSSEHR